MIIDTELNAKHAEVQRAVSQLLEVCQAKQDDPGDLLLALIHATNRSTTQSPAVGFTFESHAAREQDNFITEFRKSPGIMVSAENYAKITERKDYKAEGICVQMEMMAYLKFWEADLYQRMMLHLSRISLGRPFNWSLRISDNTSKNWNSVRAKLGRDCGPLKRIISAAYSHDIRNCIAHSQYFFTERIVTLLSNEGVPLEIDLNFDSWRDRFTKTLLFHNQLVVQRDRVLRELSGEPREIKVIRADGTEYRLALCWQAIANQWVPCDALRISE